MPGEYGPEKARERTHDIAQYSSASEGPPVAERSSRARAAHSARCFSTASCSGRYASAASSASLQKKGVSKEAGSWLGVGLGLGYHP